MAEVIVVHGYPGSGKTTQCERVAEESLLDRSVQYISVDERLHNISSHHAAAHSPQATPPTSNEAASDIIFEAINEDRKDLILIENYPRYAYTVNKFHTDLQLRGHHLSGVIDLDVSLSTSEKRILERGPLAGEDLTGEAFESFATYKFNYYKYTTHPATLILGSFALIKVIDANGDKDEVHSLFTSAIKSLTK